MPIQLRKVHIKNSLLTQFSLLPSAMNVERIISMFCLQHISSYSFSHIIISLYQMSRFAGVPGPVPRNLCGDTHKVPIFQDLQILLNSFSYVTVLFVSLHWVVPNTVKSLKTEPDDTEFVYDSAERNTVQIYLLTQKPV